MNYYIAGPDFYIKTESFNAGKQPTIAAKEVSEEDFLKAIEERSSDLEAELNKTLLSLSNSNAQKSVKLYKALIESGLSDDAAREISGYIYPNHE